MKCEITVIKWQDSYGATAGWMDLEGYRPEVLEIVSTGVNVFEDKKIIALAPNYAKATTYTPKQGNGIMVIPKKCIVSITSFSC